MPETRNAILCVDDEKTVLETLQQQLKSIFKNKYLIEIAESGEEAIEVLDDLLEDGYETILIITDWQMPGMKGDELLIHVNERHNKIIKILLTGHAPEEAVQRAFNEAKLDHYIQKPWKKDDLEVKIELLK